MSGPSKTLPVVSQDHSASEASAPSQPVQSIAPQRIEFSRDLYPAQALRATADAFSDVAKVAVEELDHVIAITITDPDPAYANTIADELANYALTEVVVAHRGGGASHD